MQPTAIQIIRDEHLAIAAVVYSLRQLVRHIRDDGQEPNFRLLHAMLDYIVEYPDRWHHPKENDHLFAALRKRNAKATGLIDELEAEHVACESLIEDLKAGLTRFERGEAGALAPFAAAVEHYAQFQWDHMHKEEDILMPLAEKSLTPDDWRAIAWAFQENDNPLFGIKPKEQAEALYRRILSLAPPPTGMCHAP
jgi:hemerythrin-like domain-containing protein